MYDRGVCERFVGSSCCLVVLLQEGPTNPSQTINQLWCETSISGWIRTNGPLGSRLGH